MSAGILSHQEILELHAAVTSAGMSEMRTGLLAHVDSDFAASLKVAAAPAEQVLTDLSMMNTAGNLANGTVPLEAWLSNAVALAGGRREVQVFAQMLERVRTRSLVEARHQAIQAAAEATATVAQLRAIGVTLSRLSLEMLGRAALMGEFPWSVKIGLRDNLKSQLQILGVSEAEIATADRTFVELLRYRHARAVVDAAREECLARRGGKPDGEYMGFQTRADKGFDFGTLSLPSPDQLRETVAPYSSEKVEQALADYEAFDKSGKLRATDMFDS